VFLKKQEENIKQVELGIQEKTELKTLDENPGLKLKYELLEENYYIKLNEISSLKLKIESLKNQNALLDKNGFLNEKKVTIEGEENIQFNKKQISVLLQRIKTIEEKNRNLLEENTKLNFKIKSLSKENKIKKNENSNITFKINSLKKHNKSLLEENTQLRSKIESLQENINITFLRNKFFLDNFNKFIEGKLFIYFEINEKFYLIIANQQDFENCISKVNKEIIEINSVKAKFEIKSSNNNNHLYLYKDLFLGNIKDIEDYICLFCSDIIRDPFQCAQCKNLFCENCINKHVKIDNRYLSCNNNPFNKQNINQQRRKILEPFEFECPLGCSNRINYFDVENNKEICLKVEEEFEYDINVKKLTSEVNLKKTHFEECEKLKIRCRFCTENIHKFGYVAHLENCSKYLFNCVKCKINYPREYQYAHDNFFCELMKNFLNQIYSFNEANINV